MQNINDNQASRWRIPGLRVAGPVWAALAVGLAMGGCKKAAPAALPPPVVQVADITTTNAPMTTEIIGQLDSPQNVEVRARVEAFVDKVLFAEGTELKEGTPLFLLDKKPFEQRLAAANGMLAEAKAGLHKYEKDVARLTPLAEKKAIPQQDLDNALASVEVGKASVLSAQARVESAIIDLGYCDVHAPISGLIGAKQVSVGELVGKGQPTLMATMSTLDPIWFYCAVSEAQYLKAETEVRRTGKQVAELPVTLILTDGSVHPAKGKFVFIDRAVDIKTGTLRVRAEFANTEKLLRPGMFGRIKIDLGARADSILIPERAVAELQGKNFVWVIGPDNKAAQRSVKVGEPIGENALVTDGLKAGDRIVVEGLQKVREGALVQPLTAGQIAQAAKSAASQSEEPKPKE
ncbi:MAG TPA: efflux RND transporter periplasmic adaptor subunit [Candidatus Dormibacteraeota bacterium]|nr:efflux RND transporter periplasmic adaptor subunit [Candidatus Dormibacteraeota bacterium]